jgi:F-type H+-transporting ATPase subunit b
MQFDWWTFGFQIINVLVLIWLLSHFLFRPVADIIAKREAETQKVLHEAEEAKHAAKQAQTAALAEVEKHAAERSLIHQTAKEEADQHKAAILEDARQEAAKIVRDADARAARLVAQAGKSNSSQAKKLALSIAQRLIANLPSDGRVSGYPERLADALKKLNDDQTAAILDDDQGLHLVSPAPLSRRDVTAIKSALKSATGRDVPLEVEIDESLVAGLELKSRHGVIHNSLKADLEHVSKALLGNE